MAQLAAYSIRQDGAIAACDATRAGLVEVIDLHNEAVKPRRKWWPF